MKIPVCPPGRAAPARVEPIARMTELFFTLPGDNAMAALTADLFDTGYAICPDFITEEARLALRAQADQALARGETRRAGIGREQLATRDATIRKAQTLWIERGTPIHDAFLDWSEALRRALNQQTFLGLFEFEAHYAHYPVGGFYARHRDSFAGARNRTISLVLYLNDEWRADWHGALALYDGDTDHVCHRVLPEPGTAVFMMAETQWHAVEQTRAARCAIAGWWRVNQSGFERVDPPR